MTLLLWMKYALARVAPICCDRFDSIGQQRNMVFSRIACLLCKGRCTFFGSMLRVSTKGTCSSCGCVECPCLLSQNITEQGNPQTPFRFKMFATSWRGQAVFFGTNMRPSSSFKWCLPFWFLDETWAVSWSNELQDTKRARNKPQNPPKKLPKASRCGFAFAEISVGGVQLVRGGTTNNL